MVTKPSYFEVEMGPESREFLLLPDYLQKIIVKCHEWREPPFLKLW
jgi:hypothetical protein